METRVAFLAVKWIEDPLHADNNRPMVRMKNTNPWSGPNRSMEMDRRINPAAKSEGPAGAPQIWCWNLSGTTHISGFCAYPFQSPRCWKADIDDRQSPPGPPIPALSS